MWVKWPAQAFIIFYFHLFPLFLTTILGTKAANLKDFWGALSLCCAIAAEFSEKGGYLEGKEHFFFLSLSLVATFFLRAFNLFGVLFLKFVGELR